MFPSNQIYTVHGLLNLKHMSNDEHNRLGKEYPRCDTIQVVIFLTYILLWGLDSFVYNWTPLGDSISWIVKTIPALALIIAGVYLVKEGHSLVLDPVEPVFVDWGVYKISRHPMYLGGVLIYTGFTVSTLSVVGSVLLALIILLYNMFAAHEEKTMTAELGSTYTEYMKKVRRWGLF